MTPDKDSLDCRCPLLGGSVTFYYCRTCAENTQPCGRIFDCWWERFDVVGYMKENLTAQSFQRLAAYRPTPKLVSLIEMIEKAGKAGSSESSDESGRA
jgi:hypothetical protein